MDGEWILEARLALNNGGAMEEALIETFGCVSFEEKVIKLYVSSDKKHLRRDLCIGDSVVDSQTSPLPGFFENPGVMKGRATVGPRRAAA